MVKSRRWTSSRGSRLKSYFIRMATIGIADVAAKSGDLDALICALCPKSRVPRLRRIFAARSFVCARNNRFVFWLRNGHQHHPELRPDRISLREHAHDLIRRGIGRDVVIGGFASKQQIAHATADEIGLMAALAQSANDRDSEGLCDMPANHGYIAFTSDRRASG